MRNNAPSIEILPIAGCLRHMATHTITANNSQEEIEDSVIANAGKLDDILFLAFPNTTPDDEYPTIFHFFGSDGGNHYSVQMASRTPVTPQVTAILPKETVSWLSEQKGDVQLVFNSQHEEIVFVTSTESAKTEYRTTPAIFGDVPSKMRQNPLIGFFMQSANDRHAPVIASGEMCLEHYLDALAFIKAATEKSHVPFSLFGLLSGHTKLYYQVVTDRASIDFAVFVHPMNLNARLVFGGALQMGG